MIKLATFVAMPGVLAGAAMLYPTTAPLRTPSVERPAHIVEVGVAFDKAAVLAALPQGLRPVDGFTGGVGIYAYDDEGAGRTLPTGYVWVDVAADADAPGAPTRFLVARLGTDNREDATTIPLDLAPMGATEEPGPDGTLRLVAWPDRTALVEVELRPEADRCGKGIGVGPEDLLTAGQDGRLGTISMPLVLDPCDAVPISARVEAPRGHPLRDLVPLRVLWARMATPLRWGALPPPA